MSKSGFFRFSSAMICWVFSYPKVHAGGLFVSRVAPKWTVPSPGDGV